jgi:uncharacterized protein (TIGR03435 family)
MKRRLLPAAAMLATLSTVHAQAPVFEVASIKFHPEPITMSADPAIRGARVVGTASTLIDLIEEAYGLRRDQLSGAPKWAESDHYDIAAKPAVEGAVTKDQLRQMLQALLADRFQLKVHRETADVPVYALAVGRNGSKMKAIAPDAAGGGHVRTTGKGVHMETTKGTMEQLARQLSNTAGRPVIDRTGLTGFYAYTLDWFPENLAQPPDLDAPSMFQALQDQLGLRLESTKGPVEKLVIDHAEKPSEN